MNEKVEAQDPQTEMGKKLAEALAYVFMLESALEESDRFLQVVAMEKESNVIYKRHNVNMELLQRVDNWRKLHKLKR